MAEIDLEIAGAPGKVSANALRVGIQQTVGLLDEFARAMSETNYETLKWNVRDLKSNGTLHVGFWSSVVHRKRKPPPLDNSLSVANTLVGGLAAIDREAITPPYISELGMRRVEAFVDVIKRHEADTYTLKSLGEVASVTQKTGDNLNKLIEIKRTAIGSVEGRLVGINVARAPKLSIIHHVSKKSVTCIVDERYMETAKSALGKRVVVYGTLYKNLNGDTVRVQMREGNIHVFAPGEMRARLAEISGLPIPDFAKTPDTEDYLIGSRGE